MDSIAILKQLDDHISLYEPESTMGQLLTGCKRMIETQAEDIREKAYLLKATQSSEQLRIEQLKEARKEVDRLKVFRAGQKQPRKRGK